LIPLLSVVSSIASMPSLWLRVAIVGVGLGLLVLVAEWLHRYTKADAEVIRKVVHIGAGNVILLAWWLQLPAWLGIGASIVFSTIALVSYFVPILASINGVGRKSFGTFFYAVSIGVLIAWFWALEKYHYAAIGILVMTWGDGLAALVGQRLGRHPYISWGMKKSWEGSLTMTVMSYIVSFLILYSVQGLSWQTWSIPFVVAIVATTLEAFSKFGIDNLTVPIGSAAICFLLNEFLTWGG
jgi:phytol kinase